MMIESVEALVPISRCGFFAAEIWMAVCHYTPCRGTLNLPQERSESKSVRQTSLKYYEICLVAGRFTSVAQ
jgi:hypothetical protein